VISNPSVSVISSKVITATRDLTAAAGDQAITGVGFQPRAIIGLANEPTGDCQVIGVADENLADNCELIDYAGDARKSNAFFYILQASGTNQYCIVKSFDSDGFTLTWTKEGTPSGSADLVFLCLR
jgi:hypothetical protein